MKSLEAQLERERSAAACLLENLREEYQALARRDIAALDLAVSKKQQQFTELEALGNDRDAGFRACGLAAGREGIETCLHRQPHGAAHRLWEELQSLLIRCQYQNQINGGMVEISRRHVQRTLSLLQGQSPEQQTYGPSGATGVAIRSSLYTAI